jgi:hypothetical protein
MTRDPAFPGTLQNDPVEAHDLHAGQIVQVQEDDVFDYIRYYPDKHTDDHPEIANCFKERYFSRRNARLQVSS